MSPYCPPRVEVLSIGCCLFSNTDSHCLSLNATIPKECWLFRGGYLWVFQRAPGASSPTHYPDLSLSCMSSNSSSHYPLPAVYPVHLVAGSPHHTSSPEGCSCILPTLLPPEGVCGSLLCDMGVGTGSPTGIPSPSSAIPSLRSQL